MEDQPLLRFGKEWESLLSGEDSAEYVELLDQLVAESFATLRDDLLVPWGRDLAVIRHRWQLAAEVIVGYEKESWDQQGLSLEEQLETALLTLQSSSLGGLEDGTALMLATLSGDKGEQLLHTPMIDIRTIEGLVGR